MEMERSTEERPQQRRWTRPEFERLIESGILREDERLELLEGEILVMSPQGSRHSALAPSVSEALRRSLGSAFHVREHSPIGLSETSRPEPDVAVVRGMPKEYLDRLPGPQDVPLVLEISESSRETDLGTKARVYARARIVEYWVVDVEDRCVVVHREPDHRGYGRITRHVPGESVTPELAGAGPVAIAELLP